jgi:alkanesulfonate monooxygenase SsuD/methylene tetrahydromethanopterin reductase-like flavin-dependent oxidoreductase (luciferase family)
VKFAASLAFTDTEDYVELAQVAEQHGWDTLVLSDHVVHPAALPSRSPRWFRSPTHSIPTATAAPKTRASPTR